MVDPPAQALECRLHPRSTGGLGGPIQVPPPLVRVPLRKEPPPPQEVRLGQSGAVEVAAQRLVDERHGSRLVPTLLSDGGQVHPDGPAKVRGGLGLRPRQSGSRLAELAEAQPRAAQEEERLDGPVAARAGPVRLRGPVHDLAVQSHGGRILPGASRRLGSIVGALGVVDRVVIGARRSRKDGADGHDRRRGPDQRPPRPPKSLPGG